MSSANPSNVAGLGARVQAHIISSTYEHVLLSLEKSVADFGMEFASTAPASPVRLNYDQKNTVAAEVVRMLQLARRPMLVPDDLAEIIRMAEKEGSGVALVDALIDALAIEGRYLALTRESA